MCDFEISLHQYIFNKEKNHPSFHNSGSIEPASEDKEKISQSNISI